MKCLKPISIIVEKSGIDYRIPVPCGKCEACLQRKKADWVFRLLHEFNNSDSAYFITLTYNDDNVPVFKRRIIEKEKWSKSKSLIEYVQCFNDEDRKSLHLPDHVCGVCKRDVQLFLKRLRKQVYPFKIKYFLVSEYGPTSLRPHYHMLLFNFPLQLNLLSHVESAWDKGFVTVSSCNEARLKYCAKYSLNVFGFDELVPKNFLLCSKGIGRSYIENKDNVLYHKNGLRSFIDMGDYKIPLPRYFRDKIFDDEEKDILFDNYISSLNDEEIEYYRILRDSTHEEFDKYLTELSSKELDFKAKVRKKAKNHKL